MADSISITVNGKPVSVTPGTTVAAAVLNSDEPLFPRGLLCGMGVCFECRLKIGCVSYLRTCQVLCREGMVISTT